MNWTEFDILLGSGSPRRTELLTAMGVGHSVQLQSVDESYPTYLPPGEVAQYLSQKKSQAYPVPVSNQVLITADTVVVLGDEIFGKPSDIEHARTMLRRLSGAVHRVVTGVTIRTAHENMSFSDSTDVCFRPLTDDEITYYTREFPVLDKAGAYGIQDWLGLVGVRFLYGSYTNVMGLPTEKLYHYLSLIKKPSA